jgi:hypothetical protein
MLRTILKLAAAFAAATLLVACEVAPNTTVGPGIVQDPVTNEHKLFFGLTHTWRSAEHTHGTFWAVSARTTDPVLKVVVRTRAYQDSLTRYYEVQVLETSATPANDDDTGIYTFTTLEGALNVASNLFDAAGFTGSTYTSDRSTLSTWLTNNWMSANDYYTMWGT